MGAGAAGQASVYSAIKGFMESWMACSGTELGSLSLVLLRSCSRTDVLRVSGAREHRGLKTRKGLQSSAACVFAFDFHLFSHPFFLVVSVPYLPCVTQASEP